MVTELMTFDAAMQALQGLMAPPRVEHIPREQAYGRVLAAPVHADRDLPPFDRAAMDGYAFSHQHLTEPLPVTGHVAAGDPPIAPVPPSTCVSISTGAALPPGCDTVVPHEQTDRQDPLRMNQIPPCGAHVHARGSDAAHGDVIMMPSTRVGPIEMGIARMVGADTLAVAIPPHTTLLTTGNEVVQEGEPQSHQIRNSNNAMLTTMIEALGGELKHTEHLPDDLNTIRSRLAEVIPTCDVLITTGGISAGDHDYLPDAFESAGTKWTISGISMQPGKPVRVGRCDQTWIVCLPGNPVSAVVTAALILGPLLRNHLGLPITPSWRPAPLAAPAFGHRTRTRFRPAHLDDRGRVTIPSWQGSGDLVHCAGTHGLARIPAGAELHAGDEISWTDWP